MLQNCEYCTTKDIVLCRKKTENDKRNLKTSHVEGCPLTCLMESRWISWGWRYGHL